MKFLWILLISLLIGMPAGAVPYRLAVFGDSLAAGYRLPEKSAFYTQLNQALTDKGYDVSVIHASRSGETTAGGVKRQKALIDKKPDGVILELGINDAIRNIDLKKTEKNLKTLIENFQSNGIPVLLVGMRSIPTRSSAYQEQFEKMYHDLAVSYRLTFYPFFMDGVINTTVVGINLTSDKLLPDHLHPSAKGVQIMVENILPTIEQFLKKQGIKPKK
ncbi:MAG: arylesterase [Alphaproteobacteria bacterium]|nr:arylesterase [Alphaproteobacteria bacterium]